MKTIITELGTFMLLHNAEYIILIIGMVLCGVYIGWVFTYFSMKNKIKALEYKLMTDRELINNVRREYE